MELTQEVAREVRKMQRKLQSAQQTIASLKRELDQKTDVKVLRKRLVFHCHPDRGGDLELMQRLNALFDQLEAA